MNRQIFKNYFIALLLFFLVFSYTFLPIYYLPINSLYLVIGSFFILSIVTIYEPKKSLQNMEPVYWYLVFLIWYYFRLLFSNPAEMMQVDIRFLFGINIATLFFCTYYSHLKSYVVNVLFLGAITYVLFSINAFYSLSSQSTNNLANIFAIAGLDSSGETNIYQNVGMWFAILLVMSAYFINEYSKKSKFITFIFFSIFCFTFILLLTIGARGALIGGVIGLLYLLKNIDFKNILIVMSFTILVLTPIIFFNQDTLLTVSRISTLFYGDDSERIYLFTNAIDLWSQNIFTVLFGGGVKSFPVFIGNNNLGYYPHNIFLEVLSELGIVGFFIFFKIFYTVFKMKTSYLLTRALTLSIITIYCFTGSIQDLYNIFFFLGLSVNSQINE
tara:strand:+ start:28332 stop:29489 length:1158 start_codon:yes stop_codon:yes gene_type:complete